MVTLTVSPAVAQLVALEATQVIQDWNNSIPLIQGKETYVRAHLQLPSSNTLPVLVQGAQLYGSNASGPLPGSPVFPINQGGSLNVQTTNAAAPSVRGQFKNSLNFRLPPAWLNGTVTLQLVWPSGTLIPTNLVPSDNSVQVTFVPAAVPQVKVLAVDWTDANDGNHSAGAYLGDVRQRVLSCYPVASVTATFGTLPWPYKLQPTLDGANSLIASKRYDDITGGAFFPLPGPSQDSQLFRLYHGVIPVLTSPAVGDAVGLADNVPGFVSSELLWGLHNVLSQTGSHEMGHNLGRNHDVSAKVFDTLQGTTVAALGACEEKGPIAYVYPLFQPIDGTNKPTLGPLTNGQNALIYGFDSWTYNTSTREPVLCPTNSNGGQMDPNCYFDLMSYCRNGGPEDVWPSVVTYTNLLRSINAIFGSPSPSMASAPQGGVRLGVHPLGGGVGNYLIARGTVDFNAGTAQFLPCMEVTTTNTPPAPSPGTNFLLQALDASGAVLQAIQFTLEPSVVEGDDTNQSADFIVPLANNSSIHTLQLSYNGLLLAALAASPHAPTVTLMTPNGGGSFANGAVGVAWSGADADGDVLTYTVQYSADGGASWETLAVDWPVQNLNIDSAELLATTNGLIRVIASDGFNTTGAQSAVPFTVQPHPPNLSINSPADGSLFIGDQQLFLDASAIDMQDGVLSGTNVQWHSDLDDALGVGPIVTFDAQTLSEGYHAITVTARDRAGLTNSAVTHIFVLSQPPPQLNIQMTGQQAMLFWPASVTNYVLQSSTSLNAGWNAVTNAPAVTGNQRNVTVSLSGTSWFFRLVFRQ